MLIASWFNAGAIFSLLAFVVIIFTVGRDAVEGSFWDMALSWTAIGVIACAVVAQPFMAWALPSLPLAAGWLILLAICQVVIFGTGLLLLLAGMAEMHDPIHRWLIDHLPDQTINRSLIAFGVCWLVELIISLVVA